MEQDRLRRRVTREDSSVSGSARRRLWAQLNISNVEPVRQLEFGNRSTRLLVAEPRVRCPPKEKECRALMVSRLRHNSTSRRSSGSPVARLRELTAARDSGSRKVGSKDNQKKRHPQVSNNFAAIKSAAPEREQTNHNRIEVFLCDGLGFRPHLLLNVFRPAYSLGDVTSPNGV